MYAAHFGLRELPFNNTPDPRYFYATPDHEEALASLIYTVSELKGYVLLTGEVGTGKTLVSRMMLRHFGDRISSAVITNTSLGPDELLAAVCTEFDLQPTASATRFDLFRTLQDHLLAEFAANRPVVLVLDEGQNLPDEAFEQLRMIGNLEADDAKLLQIVILGQPELRDRFGAPGMRQLRQRIFRVFHLSALSREVCADYVRHRLSTARVGTSGRRPDPGLTDPLQTFDDEAIDTIYRYSEGLPRLINTLCDNAMLAAYAADRHEVDGELMESVAAQTLGSDLPHAVASQSSPAPLADPLTNGARQPPVTGETSPPDVLQSLGARLARLEAHTTRIARRTGRLATTTARQNALPQRPVARATPARADGSARATAPRTSPNDGVPGSRDVEARLRGLINRANNALDHDPGGPCPDATPLQRLAELNRAIQTVSWLTDEALRRVTHISRAAHRTCHRLSSGPAIDGASAAKPAPETFQELSTRSQFGRDLPRSMVDPTHEPPDCPTTALARHVDQLADVATGSVPTFQWPQDRGHSGA